MLIKMFYANRKHKTLEKLVENWKKMTNFEMLYPVDDFFLSKESAPLRDY